MNSLEQCIKQLNNIKRIIFTFLTVVIFTGCATNAVKETVVEDEVRTQPKAIDQEVVAENDWTSEVENNEEYYQQELQQQIKGTGEFINAKAANRREPPVPNDGEVTLNFEGQDIQEVIKIMLGDLLQQNYIIGPGVSGKVTFSTAKPIRQDQLMAILEMLLSWNGAALVYTDGRYNVLPKNDAIPGNLVPRTGSVARGRGYEVRVVPLEYISPMEMEKLLSPFARQGAIVNVDPARNLIVLAGTARELKNYMQTIETFDVDWLAGMSVGIYPLERVEVGDVVSELNELFGSSGDSPLSGMFRFMEIERLNAVLVITPQPSYLAKAEEWIERLDRGGSESGVRLYVYNVLNVKATDLSETLSDVFGSSGSRNSSNRRQRGGSVAPGLEIGEITSINDPRRKNRQQDKSSSSRNTNPRSNDGRGLALVEGEDIKITAVEESNALLIRATPQQYDSILSAIKRLDVIPLQVHIEAQVLEVLLTDNMNYGVQWFFESGIDLMPGLDPNPGDDDDDDGSGGISGALKSNVVKSIFDRDDQTGLINGNIGLNYSYVGPSAGAIVSALQKNTNIKSIAAPSMMVLNNKEATINVGDQIPVNSPIFNTGSGSNIGQSTVQFRDTGVILNVTPRVNPGGLVFMEISQEVSAPTGTADSNGNTAVRRRKVDTEVAVQSGETVLLGGLILDSGEKNKSGIPILKDIPVFGSLFGTHGETSNRTELVVLITPKVVQSREDANEITAEYRKRFKGIEPLFNEQRSIKIKPVGEE